jgi:hypothetical protein
MPFAGTAVPFSKTIEKGLEECYRDVMNLLPAWVVQLLDIGYCCNNCTRY